ncbi:MAG TPA: hypothetical protein VI382_05680 [Candidatus Manganitrophaceae bacterium]|nr:hypothetical protein [Candidatus Manganitrophaceae bacterium]
MSRSTEQNILPARERVPFDLVFFGAWMIFSGFVDTYFILANPQYALPVFGVKLGGPAGWFLKSIAPPIHFFLGYGALFARRWAYLFLMGYSFYGLLNATVNRLFLPPPHRIRTIFIVGTILFMGYLYWRRGRFKN